MFSTLKGLLGCVGWRGVAVMGALAVGGCAQHGSGRGGPFQDVAERNKNQSSETALAPERAEAHAQTRPEPAVVAQRPPKAPATSVSGLPVTPTTTPLVPSTQHRAAIAPVASSHEHRVIPLVDRGHAVLVREWPVSVAYRPSGDVLAGPTYWPSEEAAYKRSELVNMVMEPLEFGYNTLLLPVRAILTLPGSPVVYSPVNKVRENR